MTAQTDARMIIGKWLNEQPNSGVDRGALAELCAEIAALRKELDQSKETISMLDENLADRISRIGELQIELEQVRTREAEIIAQAKEEQREMDAVAGKEWAMELCEESWKPESIFNAIRNNKE